jgi:glycerate 2-kinase
LLRPEGRISTSAAPAAVGAGLAALLELYDAAIGAAASGPLTARAVAALDIDRSAPVWLFAFGKAARSMAAAAVTSLLKSLGAIAGGVIVTPEGGPPPYPTLISMRGDHPVPGHNSFTAAAKIADVTSGRRSNDVAIVLISGGTSSLIAAPLRDMSEADLIQLYEVLLGSGLDIAAMNAVRKRFSRWSCGRLAVALAPATTHCLAISDVAGDDLSVIGSGPCVPDSSSAQEVTSILERADLLSRIPETHRAYLAGVARGRTPHTPATAHPAFAHVTARVIGNTKFAVDGIAASAHARSLTSTVVSARLAGEAARAGEAIAQELIGARARGASGHCVIWGGETTVTLATGPGNAAVQSSGGGRCQELALAAARVLHEAGEHAAGITLLAAGTDGRDGATEAAGAIIDATTWTEIVAAGRDPAVALASHESNGALASAKALIPRRETGTNVNDVVIGLL